MNKLLKKIPFHDGGKLVDEILLTLGKKTKQEFVKALYNEYLDNCDEDYQYMLTPDIMRVAANFQLK